MQIPRFRIWHKELKIMRDVFCMRNLGDETDLLIDTYGTKSDNTLFMWSIDEVELMQWTGLQDSNGLDVYEGDILCHDFGGGVDTCVIERNPDDCQLHVRYLYVPGYNTDHLAEASLDSWITVGNIYEHPHLLEETNSQLLPPEGGSL